MKKVGFIQKYSGKEKMTDEDDDINSKENEEKIEDAKEEINEIPPIMQIDYDELPEGVYDFAGLAELQHRRTKPNPRENEKLLKTKFKKGKRELEKKHKKINTKIVKEEEHKNIVEELFVEKKTGDEPKKEEPVIIENVEKDVETVQESIVSETPVISETVEEVKQEENKISEIEEEIEKELEPTEDTTVLEEKVEEKVEYNQEVIPEDGIIQKIVNWCTPNKRFAFCIMFLLGIATQISFLASNRQNNLFGLGMITMSAISMFLLVNILNMKNKILISILSIVAVLIPEYNDVLITGESAILYSGSIVIALISLNLIFVRKNKIICFILSAITFALGYKICQICMEIFLVVGIIKIIKDIFNRTEKISNFLLHCVIICAILSLGIFL